PAVAMVGVGMSFPYLILCSFPEAMRKFPRVGPWAEIVKQMTGFILLGFAVYFAAIRLVAAPAYWWAPVPVAAVASFYLLTRTIQITPSARAAMVSSTLAVVMLGSVLGLAAWMSRAGVAWQPYSDDALARARSSDQIVLVKFTAGWCLNCQTVEATVFHDNSIIDLLTQYKVVPLKADLTAKNAAGWPLLRKLNQTGGIPLTAVYAPGSDEPVQLAGTYTPTSLADVVKEAADAKSLADSR
ncbi:MAG: thioredoxin family protein, partial [Tepidisphaerales bacterium]